MNKKGDQTLNLLLAVIVIGIIAIILIVQINKGGDTLDKAISQTTKSLTNDYDGDGIVDKLDQSPCVTGEELVVGKDKKTYFYYSDDISQENCPEKGFKKIIDSQGLKEKEVCVMTRDHCGELIIKYYKSIDEKRK